MSEASAFFTKCWFASTVTFILLGWFEAVQPEKMILNYEAVKRMELWRLVTAAFYYPFHPLTALHILLSLYLLYTYSYRLETTTFAGNQGEFLIMFLFIWMVCCIIGLILDIPVLMDPMVFAFLYIWCQLNKDVIFYFIFSIQFKAMYLPWIIFFFNFLISLGGFLELIGIFAGFLYMNFVYSLDEVQ